MKTIQIVLLTLLFTVVAMAGPNCGSHGKKTCGSKSKTVVVDSTKSSEEKESSKQTSQKESPKEDESKKKSSCHSGDGHNH